MMRADVQRLVSESGELTAVLGRSVGSDRFAALALVFAAGTLHCRCNDDTDEIIVEVVETNSLDYPAVDDGVLVGLVGMVVEYAWEMTNHRGYGDAFQLRFRDAEGHEETRQFEVGASAMDVRRVIGQVQRADDSSRTEQ
jgi:hypothetical protein